MTFTHGLASECNLPDRAHIPPGHQTNGGDFAQNFSTPLKSALDFQAFKHWKIGVLRFLPGREGDTAMRTPRLQLFVDRQVQGALLLRTFLYWLGCVVTCVVLLITWRILGAGPARMFWTHFDDLWFQYSPVFFAALVILPIIMFDSVRMTNKFAGPLKRLRNELRRLSSGEPVRPIKFRAHDFWPELADEFNKIVELVDRLKVAANGTPVSASSVTASASAKPTAAPIVTLDVPTGPATPVVG